MRKTMLSVALLALALPAAAEWTKTQEVDQMTDAKVVLVSTSTADGDSLNLGCAGKKGTDLVAYIVAKSFVPRVLRRQSPRYGRWWTVPALIRLDDDKADKSGFDADPGKPSELDFEGSMTSTKPTGWVRKIEKAQRLRVSVEATEGPDRVMDFDLRGLDPKPLAACYESKR